MPGQKMDGLFKGWCLFKISYTEETETGRDAGRDRERYPLMLMSVLRVMCFNVTCANFVPFSATSLRHSGWVLWSREPLKFYLIL